MGSSRVNGFRLLIFIAVVIVFFMRPFALGLDNSLYSTIALLIVALLINIVLPATNSKGGYILFNLVFFYVLDIVGRAFLAGIFGVMSFASVGQALIVFLLFQNEKVKAYFFKYLKNIFLVLCVLGIVNFILETMFSQDKLLLMSDLSYNNNTYSFNLYFPLSWSGMNWLIPGQSVISGTHVRQYYFFIEPGMVPTFFVAMMFIILSNPKEKNKIFKIVLLSVGVLLTFSLGGIVVFMSAMVVYMLLGVQMHGRKKILYVLLAFFFIYLTWYAYNYMPIFGKMARMEISQQSVDSIETHENVGNYVLIGSTLIWLLGWRLSKYKSNRRCYLTIVFILGIGYLSNYIGFTTLATIFLFWDNAMDKGAITSANTQRVLLNNFDNNKYRT